MRALLRVTAGALIASLRDEPLGGARDAGRERTDALGCFGGFGAGVCIGVLEERTAYVVELAVWDAATARTLGGGQSRIERKFGVVGLLLPIPCFGPNVAEACEAIRDTLRAMPPR